MTKSKPKEAKGERAEKKAVVKKHRVSFEERLEQCKEFKKKNGHCKIKTNSKDDQNIGVWVQEVRRNFKLLKQGKPTRAKLSDEQIALLDEVGFEWGFKPDPNAPESDASWEVNFAKLQEYKEENGDFDVPLEGETEFLGKWTRVQRLQKKKKDSKCKSFITPDRIKKLNSIKFDWNGERKIE